MMTDADLAEMLDNWRSDQTTRAKAIANVLADVRRQTRAETLAEVDRAALRIVTDEIADPNDGFYWQPFVAEWSEGDTDAGYLPQWTWYVDDDAPGDPSLTAAIFAAVDGDA